MKGHFISGFYFLKKEGRKEEGEEEEGKGERKSEDSSPWLSEAGAGLQPPPGCELTSLPLGCPPRFSLRRAPFPEKRGFPFAFPHSF